jgi:hypothetical protein
MSDTPMTDAAIKEYEDGEIGDGTYEAAYYHFAQKMADFERELAESHAREMQLREALMFIPASGSMLGHAAETKRIVALTLPPPPYVAMEDARALVELIELASMSTMSGQIDEVMKSFKSKYPKP